MVNKQVLERRRGIRAKRIITIRHRLSKRNGKASKTPWQLSTTKDMSVSGLLFLSPQEYNLGDILELQVVMSGVLDIFNGYAEIVRLDKSKTNVYAAVKYVQVKSSKRAAKKYTS